MSNTDANANGETPTQLPFNPSDGDDIPTSVGNRRDRYQASIERATEQRIVTASALGYLFIVEPHDLYGRYFMIRADAVIGSGQSSAITLEDSDVSDPHARIKLEEDANHGMVFALYDFGGDAGTYCNGYRVTARTLIMENDIIDIGQYRFVFKTLLD